MAAALWRLWSHCILYSLVAPECRGAKPQLLCGHHTINSVSCHMFSYHVIFKVFTIDNKRPIVTLSTFKQAMWSH